ncbi:MAG: transcriptional repressor LexA [Alphaproteobacteria bacterium]|nr:transcriptional repressor LexA [Alphaproteobacteria bacterium]
MLTQKQHDLLIFLDRTLKETGVCPSFDEMKNFLGLKSKSGVHRLLNELEDRRFVRRLPNKARALEVLSLPAKRTIDTELVPVSNDDVMSIPLCGRIAAGLPIEAIRYPSETVAVPSQMMGLGEHYALTVDGDSMKNAGIMDGDTVIIRRTDRVSNGTIVVALIDGYEVTLKRYRINGSSVALEPENENYETRIFSADRVEVQGELVGLMRSYR